MNQFSTFADAAQDMGNKPAVTDQKCKIVCPHCGAPWAASNISFSGLDAADQCEDGRFGPETVDMSIDCHACGRELLYRDATPLR